MFQLENPPSISLVTIGRTMGRERRQNGWVKKTGKKPKTWTGYWYVYLPDENGGERYLRRKKVLGECAAFTRGAAEDKLKEIIAANQKPVSTSTFGDLAAWYLKTNEGLWTKKWRGTVAGFFKCHILPELGHMVAAKLKRSEIQQTINMIAAKPNCQSGSMVSKCLTQIRAVFEAAIDDDVLERNPALKITLPATRKASERFLELHECRRLLEVASQRDNLILRLFMVIGFRPAELFALRVNDVRPGTIRIDQTVVDYKLKDGAKTEGSVGDVPLPPELEAALREYIRTEGITDLLFPSEAGTPISPDNYLDRTLKQLGILAGIDVFANPDGSLNSRLNHQVLRRTTGTHFQKHGEIKDTQALLRHANARTTLEHYQKKLDQSLISGVNSWDAELVPRKGPGTEQSVADKPKRRAN